MSVYAAAADGAQTVRRYQQLRLNEVLENAQGNITDAGGLQKRQLDLLIANQNLQFANDIMTLVLRNISQLQP
jgi:trans-aconitate methyltransferase